MSIDLHVGGSLRNGLTRGQSEILGHHSRGLARAAQTFADRSGHHVRDMLFVVADRRSSIGSSLKEVTGVAEPAPNIVVLPTLARELQAWTAQLALNVPVWDSISDGDGPLVIVVDDDGAVAVCRLSVHVRCAR